jgi:hypothetical protein
MSERKKLTDELDKLCSLYVRNRDRKCILCGGHVEEIKSLQSHHWIVSRARSLKYRFDPRNCVSLCYACHILKIHNNPTISLLEDLKTRALIEGVVTEEDIQEIKENSRFTYKMSIDELRTRIMEMKRRLENV